LFDSNMFLFNYSINNFEQKEISIKLKSKNLLLKNSDFPLFWNCKVFEILVSFKIEKCLETLMDSGFCSLNVLTVLHVFNRYWLD